MSSRPRQVVFVDDEYRQNHTKKRPAERACDECRRKKKRCQHEPPSDILPTDLQPNASSSSSPTRQYSSGETIQVTPGVQRFESVRSASDGYGDNASGASSTRSPAATRPSFARFIGDLNPEREFRSPDGPSRRSNENSVGLWHAEALEAPSNPETLVEFAPASLFYHCSQLTRRLLLPIMEEECLAIIPPLRHLQALESFYFEQVHPLLPAVDRATYFDAAVGSPSRILQAQALVLAAHPNPNMSQHLILPRHQVALSPGEFARAILGAMRLNIELALTADKTVLIRTLATMSIFAYTHDMLEVTCQFFSRAVHLMFTIGLHQTRLNSDSEDTAMDGLFCYVWALDKLHAAIQGRPVAIHDRDMSISPLQRSRGQGPGFRVFVNIADFLDQVIDLYRPNNTANEIPSSDIRSFEDIVEDCEALALPSSRLETLELFYNAVVILSCRSRTGSSSLGFLAPSSRQSHAASQIATILEEDTSQELVLLPHVPYAVSLSVSTAYRQIRHSQMPKSQLRARKQIHQNLRHLKNMSGAFWAAAVMAELARKALIETRDVVPASQQTASADGQAEADSLAQHNGQNPYSRRQSVNGAFYGTIDQQSDQLEWHVYQEPGETPLFDLGPHLWNYHDLDGLLDSSLELGIPNFFLDGDREFHEYRNL